MATVIEHDALNFRALVRPGDMVAWGQASGEPLTLTETLMAQRHAIGPFRVFTGICQSPTADPQYADRVEFYSYHGGGTNRRLLDAGKLGIVPIHYSAVPNFLRKRVAVLLLQVPSPDASGNFSLGLSQDYVIPLLDSARIIVAEINDRLPWVEGSRTLSASRIGVSIKSSRPPLEMTSRPAEAMDRAVAEKVAGLIEDGATLQLGIGTLPAAILAALAGHRRLGIHSGALVDGVVDLIEAGVVDNSCKSIDPGVTIGGLLLGTRRLWDFANRNPRVSLRSIEYTHDIAVLSRLDKFVALNSAIEVDLTGQINAEVAGGRYVGAVGGAVDFLRGASRSRGGLPVVALRSRVGGKSTIVTNLSGPVSTSRADAGLIVTEYGIADLRGLSISQRIKRMIDIAHPDDRAMLATANRSS